jgi:hypothetical protein
LQRATDNHILVVISLVLLKLEAKS